MKRMSNENDRFLANRYTFFYNLSAACGIIVAPVCGLIIDYRAYRGEWNFFLINLFSWLYSRSNTKNVEYFNFTNY